LTSPTKTRNGSARNSRNDIRSGYKIGLEIGKEQNEAKAH
jgi:hypothetical protein